MYSFIGKQQFSQYHDRIISAGMAAFLKGMDQLLAADWPGKQCVSTGQNSPGKAACRETVILNFESSSINARGFALFSCLQAVLCSG
jgi:hypothetical protein